MSYTFEPKSNEELEALQQEELKKMLLDEGLYKMKVFSCEQKTSGSGNEMFAFVLKEDKSDKQVRTWLVLTDKWHGKFKAACESFGLEEKYKSGEVDERDFNGQYGYCAISQKHEEQYGWKNIVEGFLTKEEYEDRAVDDVDLDQDVPF